MDTERANRMAALAREPRVIPFGDHLDMIDQRNRLMERACKAEAERDALRAERDAMREAIRNYIEADHRYQRRIDTAPLSAFMEKTTDA